MIDYQNRWYLGAVLITLFIGIISAIIYYSYARNEEVPYVRMITIEQLNEMVDEDQGIVIVDLRSPDSFRQGRVSGAVNIPIDQFDAHVNELVKEEKVILLSLTEEISLESGKMLLERGSKEVYVLEGGIASLGN
ncbi:rhodanese-like domain-containing protein [Paenibacillus antri]|uniref:Rhodanese-like domain-containing protein n=1 Tax=Paenibacillus antri TaxID=2582848 RepID=A0A5R9GF34_9BACL|nr:rhodanese-like domain-containing protein [Paenibacillus antri]TLS50015.1 rhodanese-like domain-containing protein [Paenibacillus antri]